MRNRAGNLKWYRVACLLLPALVLLSPSDGWAASDEAEEPAEARETPEALEPVAGFALRHNAGTDGQAQPGPMRESADWRVSDFAGKGAVRVEDGVLYLEEGNDMTGVTWRGPLVRKDYEITLEAMRVDGSDFFCGLTFPVGEDPCSLILGGWGGSLVGISSIDYQDAANNTTTRIIDFENGRWYRVRLRVYGEKIEAWLDDEKIVDVVTTGHKIGIRWEVEPSAPLGIATWRTTGAIRNMELRALTATPPDYEVKR
ncbi:MAG TPA: DUF1080 domain-containing protein [Candidatus Hydrogenedentes bacterium]|nr:DUF1080 domain-containing protein [Candidatus Hydrogenedentota bacterium]HNT87610.1 DUF1080 domain-containing protein [Candidatus Hydrogenedentota bacterium]